MNVRYWAVYRHIKERTINILKLFSAYLIVILSIFACGADLDGYAAFENSYTFDRFIEEANRVNMTIEIKNNRVLYSLNDVEKGEKIMNTIQSEFYSGVHFKLEDKKDRYIKTLKERDIPFKEHKFYKKMNTDSNKFSEPRYLVTTEKQYANKAEELLISLYPRYTFSNEY